MLPLFNVVLLCPEIPHNTGAIGRLCVGLGCPLHLVRPLGFHLTSEYIHRAGLDYWEFLDLKVHDNWNDFIEYIQSPEIYFLSTKGKKTLYQCCFKRGASLVFGNESRGLPAPMYETYADSLFKIPMPGANARSINLANAVSIAAYEAFRQIESQ